MLQSEPLPKFHAACQINTSVNLVYEILSPYLMYSKIFMLMIIFNVYCLFGCKNLWIASNKNM